MEESISRCILALKRDFSQFCARELADTVVNGDTLWESLREECRENAEAYFAEHPASSSPVEDGAAGS